MPNKIVSAHEAAELIYAGDTVTTAGFVGTGVPDKVDVIVNYDRTSIDDRLAPAWS